MPSPPLPSPFRWRGEHVSIGLGDAHAVFTTRRGGRSSGAYSTLNLGRWTADDPQAVEANRTLVEEELGVRFAYARQVHGTRVLTATRATDARAGLTEADGHATATPGVAPMVLTADCLPVALAAPGAVAMIHAGWRGLAGGVLEAGVRALRKLGGEPATAAIGPGAGPCCYQVGEEVHREFVAHGPSARRGGNLDLKAVARAELARLEVPEVHDCGLCTMCADPSLFFSHRRDGGVTGRQAGIAWVEG